jgi:hypothetical protein
MLTVTVENSELLNLGEVADFRDFQFSVAQPFGNVLAVELVGGLLQVTPLTPGGEYSLTCKRYVDDVFDSDEQATVVAPPDLSSPDGDIIAIQEPRPFGILEALSFAVGKELQSVGGAPATRVTADLLPGRRLLRVRSTLGFPSSGRISVEGLNIPYVAKADTAFLLEDGIYSLLNVGTLVMSDVKAIEYRSTP